MRRATSSIPIRPSGLAAGTDAPCRTRSRRQRRRDGIAAAVHLLQQQREVLDGNSVRQGAAPQIGDESLDRACADVRIPHDHVERVDRGAARWSAGWGPHRGGTDGIAPPIELRALVQRVAASARASSPRLASGRGPPRLPEPWRADRAPSPASSRACCRARVPWPSPLFVTCPSECSSPPYRTIARKRKLISHPSRQGSRYFTEQRIPRCDP